MMPNKLQCVIFVHLATHIICSRGFGGTYCRCTSSTVSASIFISLPVDDVLIT